jgi:hypothetical protein
MSVETVAISGGARAAAGGPRTLLWSNPAPLLDAPVDPLQQRGHIDEVNL